MPDPTGDNVQIPPWILPYVRGSREVISAQTVLVISAVVLKQTISLIEDQRIRNEWGAAASKFLAMAINESGFSDLPGNPHSLLEAASQIGRLSHATKNEQFRKELVAAAHDLYEGAQRSQVRRQEG